MKRRGEWTEFNAFISAWNFSIYGLWSCASFLWRLFSFRGEKRLIQRMWVREGEASGLQLLWQTHRTYYWSEKNVLCSKLSRFKVEVEVITKFVLPLFDVAELRSTFKEFFVKVHCCHSFGDFLNVYTKEIPPLFRIFSLSGVRWRVNSTSHGNKICPLSIGQVDAAFLSLDDSLNLSSVTRSTQIYSYLIDIPLCSHYRLSRLCHAISAAIILPLDRSHLIKRLLSRFGDGFDTENR